MATTELEKVVAEIKQGKRIVIFPPGTAHLAITVVLSMVGFVFLAGPVTQLFLAGHPVSTTAIVQLCSLLIPIVGVVIPCAMIVKGKKRFALWLRTFLFAWVLTALAIAAFAFFMQQNSQAKSLLISVGLCSGAIWLSSRAKFLLLCEFFFLLKR